MIHSYGTGFVDFPGMYALTLYFGGCNMRCPFCFNMDVVLSKDDQRVMEHEVARKIGSLDACFHEETAIVFSGGEPTVAPDFDFWVERAAGHPLGIHTNGIVLPDQPDLFKSVILSLKPKDCYSWGRNYYIDRIEDALALYSGADHREIRIVEEPKSRYEMQELLRNIEFTGDWTVRWVEKQPLQQGSLGYD